MIEENRIISGNRAFKTSLRFSKDDLKKLEEILSKYPREKVSTVFRKLILAERRPVLSKEVREELYTLVLELNHLGRNLNQLLKYKYFDNVADLLNEIKTMVKRINDQLIKEY